MKPFLLEFLFGASLLLAGGELLFRGIARWSSQRRFPFHIFRFIGLSAPAVMVCVQATATGSPDIALGSVMGGSMFILLFVLGVLGIRGLPEVHNRRETLLALPAAGLFLFVLQGGEIDRGDGLILLLAVGMAVYGLFRYARPAPAAETLPAKKCSWCDIAYGCLGLGLLNTGADVLLDGTLALGLLLALPEMTLGLTLVAMVTCLPWLIPRTPPTDAGFTVAGAVALLLMATGLAALVTPIAVSSTLAPSDHLALLIAVMGGLLFAWKGSGFSRTGGIVLIAFYTAYSVYHLQIIP